MKETVPFNYEQIINALEKLKTINDESNQHKTHRMIYLFFHILRPVAHVLGDKVKKTDTPKPHKVGHLKPNELVVNNREDLMDYYYFLNPEAKPFGIMDDRIDTHDPNRDMPYDKFRSPQRFIPKEFDDMTEYMQNRHLPFIGGVSGTTRDQSKVLKDIFGPDKLKDIYWDLQLLNASFMIGNAYHSFFETMYVAARFDTYTLKDPVLKLNKGDRILAAFDEADKNGMKNDELYQRILEIINPGDNTFEGFEKWFQGKVKKDESDQLDLPLKPGSQKKKQPAKPTSTAKKSPKTSANTIPDINPDYLYENEDMETILNIMVQENNLNDIYILNNISNLVDQQLKTELQKELLQNHGKKRKILIPYNIGNIHWIGILLDIEANEASVKVYIMDPSPGADLKKKNVAVPDQSITQQIKEVYDNMAIEVVNHLVQQDATSCGVLTIENLIERAKNTQFNEYKQIEAGAEELRTTHVELMKEKNPNYNFPDKQKYGLFSYSDFDAVGYLKGKGKKIVNKEERETTTKIIDIFNNYPELNQLKTAFSAISKGGDIKSSLDRIRTQLNVVLNRIKAANNPQEMQTLLEILKDLFYIDDTSLNTITDLTGVSPRSITLIETIGHYI
jgi:hypothetical protein